MDFRKNDTFNGGRIRIDQVNDTYISFTHVPSGLQHTISIPSAQEFIDSKLWMDNITWRKENFTIY